MIIYASIRITYTYVYTHIYIIQGVTEITLTKHTVLFLIKKLSQRILYYFAIFAIVNEILISKDC